MNKKSTLFPKIGFIWGHTYLTDTQILKIRQSLNNSNEWVVSEYNRRLTDLIGPGYGISFAAGRMAFYVLMKALGIGKGDEVILLGFTCSVMPNAVLRVGAIPIFADVDRQTFGSKAEEIEKKITPRTKLIVAQHSFGIPCDIQPIVELGKRRNIFVMEDCAIALDSSVEGIKVGNWADAAIFSTDHSKPLNTLIGGFLYTRNRLFYEKVKQISEGMIHLTDAHQKRLYSQFIFERRYYTPTHYPLSFILNYINCFKKKLSFSSGVFLNEDLGSPKSAASSYPYPAKLPPFLAHLGLFELERWDKLRQRRKKMLQDYFTIIYELGLEKYLPGAYSNCALDIVPLRFVFEHPGSKLIRIKMSSFMDVNWIWFRSPVICSNEKLENLGYESKSCPVSEKAGLNILNWPCSLPEGCEDKTLMLFKKALC
jgi:dTDP-4-amino-4,6-dideoxygalactose transaminase